MSDRDSTYPGQASHLGQRCVLQTHFQGVPQCRNVRNLPLAGARVKSDPDGKDKGREKKEDWAMVERTQALVVDDDQAVRFVVQEAMERAGYVVVGASSGEQALEHYARTKTPGNSIAISHPVYYY